MKNKITFPAIVLGLLLLFTGINQKVFAQDEDVSLQTFYDELSPYGTWIQDEQYGYVWRPDVDQGEFRPYYTDGHWVMTEYGNTWVSDYDWGWAPFHYGRWVTDRYNQWLWIPDTTWGPAWVNWRTGDGYYGWAPLGPSLSINVGFNIPSFWWVFIPQSNIYYDRYPRYNWDRNSRYLRRTTVINNIYVYNRNRYYTGPSRDDIRRVTHRDVRVYNINRSDRPGRSRISDNTVHIYHPRPNRGSDNRNAAPRNSIDRGSYVRNNPGNRGNNGNNNRPDRDRSNAGRSSAGTEIRNNNRMERPQAGRERLESVRQRPDSNPATTNGGGRDGRTSDNGRNIDRTGRDRQQFDQQRQQQAQQRGQDQDRQRQQFDQQRQQQAQQMQQQREQQRQQQAQQRGQDQDRQRQQFDQQRQQQAQQMQQQREQQRQQQAQQRGQEQERQRQQFDQQREQQRQQADQQRQQQTQQMQQQREQQRQQADQQRQQQQQMQRQQRQEMPSAPQRMETRSNGGGDASRGGGGGRMTRGGGRG